MSDINTWQVKIKDCRTTRYSYYHTSQQSADMAKENEIFANIFYNTVNKIVDAGGLIDPGKYFYDNSGSLNIRATQEVAGEISKFENVESIKKY